MQKNKISHIAIIMDGNGRWAAKKKLPKLEGHRRGGEAAKKIINKSVELGINWLTLYTFSSENWKRSEEEINNLMKLLEFYLLNNKKLLLKNNIRLHVIGDISALPKSVYKTLNQAVENSKNASGMNLVLALNYGGRQEIVSSVQKIINDVEKGKIKSSDITEDIYRKYLYNDLMPDPDLLIRTSGEQRLSNFLLWQSAYTELYFTDVLWPDFDEQALLEAINSFKKRERKYGTA